MQEAILATVPPGSTQLVGMVNQLGPDLVYLERLHCGEIGQPAARTATGTAGCTLVREKLPVFRDAAGRGSVSASTAVRELQTYIGAACP